MKIAFDHQIFLTQKYGGISRYFVELAKSLSEIENSVEILSPIYVNEYLATVKKSERLKVKGIKVERIPKGVRVVSNFCHFTNSIYLMKNNFDIYHETYYSKSETFRRKGPTVLTVYDMIHEIMPEYFGKNDKTFQLKKAAIERADRIIAISNSTKRDLVNILKVEERKIDVVHLGYSVNTNPIIESLRLRPFVLYVGSRGGYKNFRTVLEVFRNSKKVKSSFDLVCFGGGEWNKDERDLINMHGLSKLVTNIQGGDDVLKTLYSQARCFIYPSLYEGFGLPPLEAMQEGCPCIVSETSSMPEVCGDAAIYFNPGVIESIQEKLELVCFDETTRSILISNGIEQLKKFSWEKCGVETLDTYKRLL